MDLTPADDPFERHPTRRVHQLVVRGQVFETPATPRQRPTLSSETLTAIEAAFAAWDRACADFWARQRQQKGDTR